MRILIRHTHRPSWDLVESTDYSDEAELQKLLAESPSLIPVHELREGTASLVVAVREFWLPGSCSADLLAFSADGDVAVVECKLAANPEIKRKVVGQILEYGASLWGMSYEDLDGHVSQRTGRSLADLVADTQDAEAWDEEGFRENVSAALSKGDFLLIIAVDQINDELRRTIRFLNGCGNPTFAFCALEMQRYQKDDTEMLVPHVHGGVGATKQRAGSKTKRRQWNKVEFIQQAKEILAPEAFQIVEDLYSWAVASEADITWGTGAVTGSFTVRERVGSKLVSVFNVQANGFIWLSFQQLVRGLPQDVLDGFFQSVHAIPGLEQIPPDFTKWPTFRIEDVFVGKPAALEQFKDAVLRLRERVKDGELKG